jgi:hypothetical protein
MVVAVGRTEVGARVKVKVGGSALGGGKVDVSVFDGVFVDIAVDGIGV